jgi:hypothetical protein
MRPRALLFLLAVVACSGDERPSDMGMNVYKFVDAQACLLQLSSGPGLLPELEAELGTCPHTATMEDLALVRGADRLEILVDYQGLEFAESSVVPAPVSTVRVDGLVQAVTVPFTRIDVGTRRGFRGPLTVPAGLGDQLSIAVEATVGYASPTRTFTLRSPEPVIEIEGCAAAGCRRTGAVGDATVHVRVPARSARSATLRAQLGDMLLPGSIPVALAIDRGGTFEGVTSVPVPAADGTTWTLIAELDGRSVVGPAITLDRPSITTQLICGAACVPGATTRTGVRITAPRDIKPPIALVTVLVAGVPLVLEGTKALTVIDATAGTISGVLEIPLPDLPAAQLTIDASVAGFPADVLLTTVGPKP